MGTRQRKILDVFEHFNHYKHFILSVPQAPSAGLPNALVQNVASLYNKGFEVSVNASPVRKKDFEWSSSFNFSTNDNKVTKLAPPDITQITNTTSSLETVS